jgi:hypothetical protein
MFLMPSDEDHDMTPEEIAKILEEQASHYDGANDVAYDDRDVDFEYDHDVDFDMHSEW